MYVKRLKYTVLKQREYVVASENPLREKINTILSSHLGIDDMERYGDDASLWDDLGTDDLDLLEITMALEEEFEIELPEDTLDNHSTIQTILDIVAKRLREKAGQWKS